MIESSESFDLQDFIVPDGLSFAYHTFECLPLSLAQAPSSSTVKKIDLTETSMKSFENLRFFTRLETLILDKNELSSIASCPTLPTVRTLWCNNNAVHDLPSFIDEVLAKFPNLHFLSMMRNPACPGLMDIINPDIEAIRLYRLYVLYRFPQLQALDFGEVTDEERREAKTRGQYAVKRRAITSTLAPPSAHGATGGGGGEQGPPPTVILSSPQEIAAAAAAAAGAKSPSFSGKLAVGGSAKRFDTKHSEGNRFIVNSQL